MLAQLNTDSQRCLAPQDLEDLDAGNLSDPELDQIFSHISTCSHCETLLKEWHSSSEDLLSDKLRRCFAIEPIRRDAALSLMEAEALDQTGPIVVRDKQSVISDVAALSTSLIGKKIGQNLIEKEIGRGGMGLVFRAWQESVKRPVAIKIIRAGLYAESIAIARFRTEAGAIARLQHANVAQLYEFAEHEGLPYFVMELVDGGSLEKTLANGKLTCRRAAELVRVVAEAVEFAHAKQVIHRDLKPSNILMTQDGEPKIADFGLAKMLDDEGSHTQTDVIMGTPDYMAPEQAAGRKATNGRLIDVYALGAILYEALTGQPPYRGTDRLDTMRRVREDELTPPSRLRADIPRDLEAVCVKCLSKSPAKRYQSAHAFADDLGLWMGDQRPREIPGFFARGVTRLRRNRIALALITMIVIGVVVAYRRDPDRPLRAMQSQLAHNQPTTLLDATGKPAWYKWQFGEEGTKMALGDDGTTVIHSTEQSLLELLPSVPCNHYRFQVRIRHETSNTRGAIGLYLAHQSFLVDGKPIHYFLELSFNDIRGNKDLPIIIGKRPAPAMSNSAQLSLHLDSKPNVPPVLGFQIKGKAGPNFEPAGESLANWRDLAVTVSPQGVIAEWEGQTFFWSADQMRQAISRQLTAQLPQIGVMRTLSLDYVPQGGLGLYIYRGSASFCSATVIPQSEFQQ